MWGTEESAAFWQKRDCKKFLYLDHGLSRSSELIILTEMCGQPTANTSKIDWFLADTEVTSYFIEFNEIDGIV